MTSLSYTRSYGDSIGLRLLTALQAAGLDVFESSEATSRAADLGLTSVHTRKLLFELAAAGRVIRVKKGLYAIVDPVTGSTTAHPYHIGTSIAQPSAISHWSALNHWGLTEQIPSIVMVSSTKRTFPPKSQSRREGATWTVGQSRFQIVTIPKATFFGVEYVWMSEFSRVPMFDRERALVDAFHNFDVFGSFSGTLAMLEEHLAEVDVAQLVSYARELGVGALAKRLGWTLSRLGVADSVLLPLSHVATKGDSPLDPKLPARGHHDSRWHVIENLRA